MNNSFLDRSMDTLNFNNPEFLEPHLKGTRVPGKIKEDNHLERIFDNSTINPHFTGQNTRDMKISFRPETSFDLETKIPQQKFSSNYTSVENKSLSQRPQQHQRPQQRQRQRQRQQQQTKDTTCQYCESYRKKTTTYETMIAGFQRKISELTNKLARSNEDSKKDSLSTTEIRRELDKINNSLKQKQRECEILENKISSIQLDQKEKDQSRIEAEIKKGNDKYYKMVKQYETVIGELRKEIIEFHDNKLIKQDSRNPMIDKLLPILSSKLNKSVTEIEAKLVDYSFPETLTSEELKKILDLYK